MKLLSKTIILLIILLVFIMVISTIMSLSIRSMEKEIASLQKNAQEKTYKIQGLKGEWNVLSNPSSLSAMIKVYLPKMTKAPLNTNIYSVPLKAGVKVIKE